MSLEGLGAHDGVESTAKPSKSKHGVAISTQSSRDKCGAIVSRAEPAKSRPRATAIGSAQSSGSRSSATTGKPGAKVSTATAPKGKLDRKIQGKGS